MKNLLVGTIAASVHLLFATGRDGRQRPKPTTQNRADIAAQYQWDFSPSTPVGTRGRWP